MYVEKRARENLKMRVRKCMRFLYFFFARVHFAKYAEVLTPLKGLLKKCRL